MTPIAFSTFNNSQMDVFSKWSGHAGYPGAGLIPWYDSLISSLTVASDNSSSD